MAGWTLINRWVLLLEQAFSCKTLSQSAGSCEGYASVSSGLCCNAFNVGLSQSSISHLHLVQNASAWILTSTSRREHITPCCRCSTGFQFSLESILNFCLFLMPLMACQGFNFPNHGGTLHSSSRLLLGFSGSRHKQRGDPSFVLDGPTLWKNCPHSHITADLSLFKSKLQTHFCRYRLLILTWVVLFLGVFFCYSHPIYALLESC